MGLPLTNSGGSNADSVINVSAIGPSSAIEFENVSFGYDNTPTGGIIKIESPVGTIIQQWPVTTSGPGELTFSGSCVSCPPGRAARITLTAGSGGVTGYVNAVQRG